MIWVLNSNSNTCKIYDYHKPSDSLKLIKEFEHPENKLKTSELVSDKPGKYKANDASRGSFSPASDPKENMINQFLHDVAKTINTERSKNNFDKLIIIAPPNIDGILMQHLDKHVKSLIICNIQKDHLQTPEKELLEVLADTPNY